MTQTPVTIVPDDATLVRLADEAARAQEAFMTGFRAKYGEGRPVRWVYGNNAQAQHGTVVRQGFMGRLYVRNAETDAEYWVSEGRVLAALRQ